MPWAPNMLDISLNDGVSSSKIAIKGQILKPWPTLEFLLQISSFLILESSILVVFFIMFGSILVVFFDNFGSFYFLSALQWVMGRAQLYIHSQWTWGLVITKTVYSGRISPFSMSFGLFKKKQ